MQTDKQNGKENQMNNGELVPGAPQQKWYFKVTMCLHLQGAHDLQRLTALKQNVKF